MRQLIALMVVMFGMSLEARAQDQVSLHSVILEDGGVRVEYSKNFVTCAHLYRFNGPTAADTITHTRNFFCATGEHVVATVAETEFTQLRVGDRVLLRHGNNGAVRSLMVTITNRPIADAGADQVVQCQGLTVVDLDASASTDPNNDALTYLWSAPEAVLLDDPTSRTPSGIFPDGVSLLTVTVTDAHGAIDTDDVIVTVVDSLPPAVGCTTNIASLAPANREMIPVRVTIYATDLCVAPELLSLQTVTLRSSEPDDLRSKSDGSTTGDTHGADGFSAPVNVKSVFTYNAATASFEGTVSLRAEADREKSGRTYSLSATVIDTHGNSSSAGCVVVVPNQPPKGRK